MVKNLKLNIKNAQLAEALNIDSLLGKKKKKEKEEKKEKQAKEEPPKKPRARIVKAPKEEKKAEPVTEPAEEKKENAVKEAGTEDKTVLKEPVKEAISETPIKPQTKTGSPAEETSVEKKEKPKEDVAIEETKPKKVFKEIRTGRKKELTKTFDSRDRQGLRAHEEERWRKKRPIKTAKKVVAQEDIIRPKQLKVRLPISIKDLAQEMKLKASQLLSKLFMQGLTLTLNDYLDDETTVQLLGHEFDCTITIDTSEEERVRITDKSIQEEIAGSTSTELKTRAPVVTFMGHVDHGKTSLIDAIRQSDVASQEAGAITQHIGAFKTKTANGEITILDTPGHEAFTQMRGRGAIVTDIAILVVAGDEGMREQTIEAMNQSLEAKVPIIVAINKSDKPSFDAQKVYRQLADNNLLPESWGGNTITVNCSASTKDGISELLELILLQAELLELKANPKARARGTVLESEMHKGFGAIATVLVQNGCLRKNDSIVLGHHWGKIKTMHDEHGKSLDEAGPSTPVKITGLSGVVAAGVEFIMVSSDKEAKGLASAREEEWKQKNLIAKKTLDKMLLEKKKDIKLLPLLIRADVQGSLEALKHALLKLPKNKVKLEIISEGIGDISESDVELASASKAVILGFHTRIETHAENMARAKGVPIKEHDIIYHAVDNIKELMTDMLDKIKEEKETGRAFVKAIFKASQLGVIAGCQVTDGTISRNHFIRVLRNDEQVWEGKIASLKRVKEDVKEVQKGVECGVLLEGFNDVQVDDILQAYEIIYHKQSL